MADYAVITHQLRLAIRLIDTSTGRLIDSQGADAYAGGKALHPMRRADGYLVFLTLPPAGEILTLRVPDYEPYDFVVPEGPNAMQEVQLIPDGKSRLQPCCTLAGQLEGLTALDAVETGNNACLMRDYDERRKIITLFNPHQLALDRTYYAVVDPEGARYEAIEITSSTSDKTFRVKDPLAGAFSNHFPVCRRVLGRVTPAGEYLLRVRDDGGESRWIVRYVVAEKEYFQTVYFGRDKPTSLAAPSMTDHADGT